MDKKENESQIENMINDMINFSLSSFWNRENKTEMEKGGIKYNPKI